MHIEITQLYSLYNRAMELYIYLHSARRGQKLLHGSALFLRLARFIEFDPTNKFQFKKKTWQQQQLQQVLGNSSYGNKTLATAATATKP